MKIYTKTGDKGYTSLIGGTRISKADLRIEAYGTIDELNSHIGLVRDLNTEESSRSLLKQIQDRLFTIGAHLAAEPEQQKKVLPDLKEEDIQALEQAIDQMEAALPPLRHFVLPGGHPSVSFCHIARTVCRRAERNVIAFAEKIEIHPLIIPYLNRLSDYLFVLARKMAQEVGAEEIKWLPRT
ncbi:MAG: cob(I)yrinic acid a,c-diamide adenosyltransferase [Cytophagales bacterium]|nr:cob(I)yrinic acid a,c-diamide adenosyltransferase [Bernardetiaceae bacterium]MDW8210232.1 cob(I)yrinic acid a,c-diamide adenosyltransferase [Cytophagales bacterium]